MHNITIAYTGQRRSNVSGHYLLGNGYRGFNPVLKRFAGQDNLSPFGSGGEHGYTYCGGEPINRSDASGHRFGLPMLLFLMVFDGTEEATMGIAIDSALAAAGPGKRKNSAGLIEEQFSQPLYRVDRLSPETVKTSGFSPSIDYTATLDKKMTDTKEALTVATSLEGARRYLEGSRISNHTRMYLYKIPEASLIHGVSLNHNIKHNLEGVLQFFEEDGLVDVFRSEPEQLTDLLQGINSLHEAHVNLEDVNCSGQQKLATTLEFFQYRFSDSLGGNPPLYSCGLSAL